MEGKNNNVIVAVVISVAVVLVSIVAYLVFRLNGKDKEMSEMVEMMNYEKEKLENEYSDMALEIEGFSMQVSNDSILVLLDKEQQRVKMLLEELRTVKATNARRISELKAELGSVRKVLVYYVAQVDSLSAANMQLQKENRIVHERFQAAAEEAKTLAEERQQLVEKVSVASQLEAYDVEVTAYKPNGRYKTQSVRSAAIFKVTYSIGKNITASVGNKVVYLRITAPDGLVLHKSETDVFVFDDSEILFSSRKNFEYGGEAMSDDIYYTVEETLLPGIYRADLFVDAHLIGSKEFSLKR